MAIITMSECLLLQCSGCGAQRLIGSSRFERNVEAPPADHPDLVWRREHDRCPPQEFRPGVVPTPPTRLR